jgi:tRNA-splicing ligase RtcB
MKVLNFENELHVKSWCDNIEDSALKQIENLSKLPFAYHHIAIMPDCHSGYGMPIGGVLATKDVVIPNAVGVDIGCGMCAVKTSLQASSLNKELLKEIMRKIREAVPVGKRHHKDKQDERLMPTKSEYEMKKIVSEEYQSALHQLGTLGGGNHFIELQKDTYGNVWIMIHSGSRNLGYKVANYYNDLAVSLNEKWQSKVFKEWELAFLPLDSQEGKNYLDEMQYCVDFALANRQLMMNRILKCIDDTLVENIEGTNCWTHEPIINIAHNYAIWENHFGKNVIVHRKGATLARENTLGIIPGSQGSKSYIVQGLGNSDSFQSCSHGAGRKMSRTKAENELNLEEEIKKLDDQGIVHGIRTKKDLDEATGAYKNIDEVMESQKDLVKILVELTPLAVIKGD